MYTYEPTDTRFAILDPDGDELAHVDTVEEAETLLSHLNR